MLLKDLKYHKEKYIILEDFEFKNHERIELLIFLVNHLGINGDIEDYYMVLGGRGLISRHSFNRGDYLVQNARILLKTINQKKVYIDELKKYEKGKSTNERLYIRQGERFVIAEGISPEALEKEELFLKLLSLEIKFKTNPLKYAFQDEKRYGIIIEGKPTEIKLIGSVQPVKFPVAKKKKGGTIKISIKDIIQKAEELDDVLSDKEKAYRKKVMENNTFKAASKGKLIITDEIKISGITNIVGQVGAGKSTFSDALVKKLSKEKRKILIIEPTVNKALKMSEELIKAGVRAVPVIGSSDWNRHIKRASDGKDFLSEYTSKILTAGCPIGGLIEEAGTTIEYGKEPCAEMYRFYEKDESKRNQLNKNDRYKCPYHYLCPRTKLQAEILAAEVIITTTAALCTMTLGISSITLFQYVLENMDLTIVDEAESELQKIDKIFSPYISYDDYIRGNSNIPGDYYKKQSDDRTSSRESDSRDFIDMHHKSDSVFVKIHRLLDSNRQGFNKSSLKRPFTGKMLILECKDKNMLPSDICEELEKMTGLKRDRRYKRLLQELAEVKTKEELEESFEAFDWGTNTSLTEEQVNKIIFIGSVLYFEELYRNISNLVEGNNSLPMSTKAILSQRFEYHQKYIPVSPKGNIFALQYKDRDSSGKSDLCIIKQFAMGRSVYLRFPWLKLDDQGNPRGPNVLLLSGSCYVPGSFANNISEKVSYVIEAEAYKREYISKAHFEFLGNGIYVSGSGAKRDARLREVVSDSKELILEKLGSKDNNILIVANSYHDTMVVKDALKNILKDTEYVDKITYLVSDSDNEEDDEKIKQSKVSDFAQKGARILVAPAILIERGHNIVDENGNAAFNILIFMARPMGRPDDYSSHVTKVNGHIMNKYTNTNYGIDTNVFNDMRKDANTLYNRLDSSGYEIQDLKAEIRRDIVVTLFVIIIQVFGRLCRIGDEDNLKSKSLEVYFADASFKAKNKNGLDFLNELVEYLDEIMSAQNVEGEIAKTLYEPFYNALKKGRHIYG